MANLRFPKLNKDGPEFVVKDQYRKAGGRRAWDLKEQLDSDWSLAERR